VELAVLTEAPRFAAVANAKPTVFITGDIGFLYDSNALWNNYIPKKFQDYRLITVEEENFTWTRRKSCF
jgi:2-succinyl-5-enolpyruvyl-6-hydroxy-3-cyclohexene-1-carboxylate synthase